MLSDDGHDTIDRGQKLTMRDFTYPIFRAFNACLGA